MPICPDILKYFAHRYNLRLGNMPAYPSVIDDMQRPPADPTTKKHTRRRTTFISLALISTLSISTASAQTNGSNEPSPSSDDNFVADLFECGLLGLALLFGVGEDGGGSSQSGPDNTYQHALNQSGNSSSETLSQPENSYGFYGNCHNPVGC